MPDASPSMAPERWQIVEAALDVLLATPPADRPRLLDALCPDDGVRHEVAALLAAEGAAGTFLEGGADTFALPYLADVLAPVDDEPGRRIASYRLVREVGRGGMGVVFLAERADGQFERAVALKLIRRGRDSDEIRRRFLHERQILARLQHSHIAQLFDGGVTEDGYPFFVMEYVEGEPITAYCDRHGLGVDARLHFFEVVCSAVHYAHQRLIVHRDLKPPNVLVTRDGVVKLLDFGIARVEGEDEPATGTASVRVLTPEYASPELVRGEPVTTASDVYQLGLLLYELLTGRQAHRLAGRRPAEIARAVCETAPPRPSAVVAEEATRAARRRAGRLAGDLDAVVMKALHKDPARRYATVEALLEDLARHRGGRPVRAHRSTVAYRTSRYLRRHRLRVLLVAGLVGLGVGFGVYHTFQMRAQRDRARLEAAKAMQSAELFHRFFENWNPDAADRAKVQTRDLLRMSAVRAEREMRAEPEVQAAMLSLLGGLYANVGDLARADTLLRRALARQEHLHRDGHPDLAATLERTGRLRYLMGYYDEAEAAYRRALAMYRALSGPAHPDALRAAQGLATVLLHGQERFEEAEALAREILALHDPAYADSSLVFADATRGLGLALYFQARTEEAEAILRPAVARHRRLFGDEHTVTMLTMQALVATLRDRGRVDEAVSMQQDVVRLHRLLYGDAHPNTLFARFVLGVNLHRQGDFTGARDLLRTVVSQAEEVHGQEHPVTARFLRMLAYAVHDLGDRDEAERLLRRSLSLYRRAYSYRHDDEAGLLNRLAFLLAERSDAAAGAVYLEARAFDESRRGPRFVTHGPHFLARAMHRHGDMDVAERCFREVLPLYRAQLPPGHPYLAATRVWMGELLLQRGRTEEARALLEEDRATR